MALTLNVPGTAASVLQPAADRTPKEMADWLQRLPFASPTDAAQQLTAALFGHNRQTMTPDKRYALMSQLSPVVARVAAGLQELIAGAGVPPAASQQLPAGVLRGLLTEHSVGYKHVLLDLIQAKGRATQGTRVAEVTTRLVAALVDTLIASFQTYSVPPAGLWLELHQLYQFALDQRIADRGVGELPSPGLSYRKALLLSLADPPQLSHAELSHTLMMLDHLASLAQLDSTADPAAHNTFAIFTDSEGGPLRQAPEPEKGELWLNTDALCLRLREIVLRLRAGDAPIKLGLSRDMNPQLGKTLGKHLYKRWRLQAKRAYKRYAAATGSIQLVAGVSAIHQLLTMTHPLARPAADPEDKLIHDVQPVPFRPVAVTITLWRVVNESAAGLSLSGSPNAPLNLKVGDALALQGDNETEWSLGLIRWVKMHDQNQIDLGVQRLSPQMQPVWVQPLRGRLKGQPEPALFIPAMPHLKQPDRLVLPQPSYRSGMDAALSTGAQPPLMLTFGACHEHTHSFDLIDFTPFN